MVWPCIVAKICIIWLLENEISLEERNLNDATFFATKLKIFKQLFHGLPLLGFGPCKISLASGLQQLW